MKNMCDIDKRVIDYHLNSLGECDTCGRLCDDKRLWEDPSLGIKWRFCSDECSDAGLWLSICECGDFGRDHEEGKGVCAVCESRFAMRMQYWKCHKFKELQHEEEEEKDLLDPRTPY